jgi:UMF1 family MFS transporter
MFDFANSSYTTLIITVAYSAYFRQAVVGAHDPRGDLLWSVAGIVSHAILILTAPILGAVADYSGRKKTFLFATTAQTVIACALLFFVRPGDIVIGMLLYVIGTVGFEGGYVFYNAFLPEVSTPRTIGRVSAWSWGTGFIGGLMALVACMPLLSTQLVDDSGRLDMDAVFSYRLSFVVVAGFFALFAVPTFLFLKERPTGRTPMLSVRDYARAGLQRVTDTLSHLRLYRETGTFVLAAFFFSGGIDAVIKFSALYAIVTFGIDGAELVLLFVFTNIVAVPGTLAAGYLADRIGGRRALALTLGLWIALLFLGASAQTRVGFWVMASGVAIGMGSTQAIGRSFMAQISPAERESEFFGFYLLTSKLGSIVALLLFGVISTSTGNQRLAVLWLVPLFVVGCGLVLSINERRAIADARRSTSDAGRSANPSA